MQNAELGRGADSGLRGGTHVSTLATCNDNK